MRKLISAVGVAAIILAAVSESDAGLFTLNAVDSGWHRSDSLHQSTNENYITGYLPGDEYRSWFVFDLSSVTGTITSAQLRLSNPDFGGYTSPDATESFSFFDVFVSISDLTQDRLAGDATGLAIFNDLGSGSVYGSNTMSSADDGTTVTTALNGNALSSLNSASGLWALGGALTTIDFPRQQTEFVFGFTGINDDVRQLVLVTDDINPVPEPTSLALFGLGAIGAVGAARRRRKTA